MSIVWPVTPSSSLHASRNPVTRLCELKPIVASNVSYKYNRLRWPSVVRWRTISRMPALSSMPTEAVNPCEAVLMPMSGIRVGLSRLISAGVMANDETMTASALPRTGSSSKNSSRAPASPIGWMTRS